MVILNHDDPLYKFFEEDGFFYDWDGYKKLKYVIDYIEDIPGSKDKKVSVTSYIVPDDEYAYIDFMIEVTIETFIYQYHLYEDVEEIYVVEDHDIKGYPIAVDDKNLDKEIQDSFIEKMKSYCEPCEMLESMEVKPPITQPLRRLAYEWAEENCDDYIKEYLEEDAYEDIHLAEDLTEDEEINHLPSFSKTVNNRIKIEDLEVSEQEDTVNDDTSQTKLCSTCGYELTDFEAETGDSCMDCSMMFYSGNYMLYKKQKENESENDQIPDDEDESDEVISEERIKYLMKKFNDDYTYKRYIMNRAKAIVHRHDVELKTEEDYVVKYALKGRNNYEN